MELDLVVNAGQLCPSAMETRGIILQSVLMRNDAGTYFRSLPKIREADHTYVDE